MLGSVSNYVTHHAPCPVVVVRGGTVDLDEAPRP
jgi:nucleotide-binding universal stress UspA family protein